MQLPGARDVRRSAARAGRRSPTRSSTTSRSIPRSSRRERHRARARGHAASRCPSWRRTRACCGTTGSATSTRTCSRDRSLASAVNGKTILITGASSGIGRAAAIKLARAGGIPLLVARSADKLEEVRDEIARVRRQRVRLHRRRRPIPSRSSGWSRRCSPTTRRSTCSSTTPGRSIRRSIALSYDRFHDFERTIQLNYLGAVKLILALLPHMRARKRGHIVNISSIGVQTSPPRFSAYVASKAALDAFTRVVGSETIADRVTFTTIHMPLVRTPMIAPTKLYNSFPTISPEEAADLICEAIRSKPKQINTRLGTFGEVAYALAPKAVDQLLHLAYRVFPDSAAAKGGERRRGVHRAGPSRTSCGRALVARACRGGTPGRGETRGLCRRCGRWWMPGASRQATRPATRAPVAPKPRRKCHAAAGARLG